MGFSKLQVAAEPKESTLPTKPSPSVRLCPHQTLSFDRLQRILALPNLMEERFRHKTVNALTATSSPPSHYLNHAETQICAPPPLAPQAASRISKAKLFCQNGDFRRLHLHSEWAFQPTRPIYSRDNNNSEDAFRRFLYNTGVWLCPRPETERPARGRGRLWALGACVGRGCG